MELLIILIVLASFPNLSGAILVFFIGHCVGKSVRRRSIWCTQNTQNKITLVVVSIALLSFILLLVFASEHAGTVVLLSIAYAMGSCSAEKEPR